MAKRMCTTIVPACTLSTRYKGRGQILDQDSDISDASIWPPLEYKA